MLVFLGLFVLFALGSTELDDVTVIRHHDTDDLWFLGIHGRTNALGKPFVIPRKGAVLEPNTGFNITYCNGWQPDCAWKLTNWGRELKTRDILLARTSDWLKPKNTNYWWEERRLSVEVAALSGTITSPNFSNNYTETDSRMHVITTVKGYNITLSFTDFDLCNNSNSICYGKVRVFDGPNEYSKQLGSFCGNLLPPVLRSSSNVMAIDFGVIPHDECKSSKGFSADFKTEMTDLVLTADEGIMTSPASVLMEPKICVTVTYQLEAGSSIDVVAELESGKTIVIGQSLSEEVGTNWRIQRFLANLGERNLLETFRVVLKARRTGNARVFIERISGCNPDNAEDAYLETSYPMPFELFEHQYIGHEMIGKVKGGNDTMPCLNGGQYDAHYGQCVCPAGFSGTTCEAACGPNRYGDDCGGICSMKDEECFGRILLRRGINAFCAPGFASYPCNKRCEGGSYGNDCKLKCGKCSENYPCDAYKGQCRDANCQDGYVAPYCQQKYKHLIDMPTLVSSDFTSINYQVNMTAANMAGVGEPMYYKIYHALNESKNWVPHDPLPMPESADVFRSRLTGLKPGQMYRILAVLIDADLGAYKEFDKDSDLLPTKCVVPEYLPFKIDLKVYADGISVNWHYSDQTDSWCPEKHVEVYLKSLGLPWALQGVATTDKGLIIRSLLPATQYYVKLRMVTVKGAVPQYSTAKSVQTSGTPKPGQVRNLRAANVTSDTISLVWDVPLGPGFYGNYIVTHYCAHVGQCEDNEDCDKLGSRREVSETFVELTVSHPFTRYKIKISAGNGDSVFTFISTSATRPSVAPKMTMASVTNITSTGFDAYWGRPVKFCKELNGFMKGYHYILTARETEIFVEGGETTDTHVSFSNMQPATRYKLQVYVLSTGGWNQWYPLTIDAWTNN